MTIAKTEMTKLPMCQPESKSVPAIRHRGDVTHQDQACTALTTGFILGDRSNRLLDQIAARARVGNRQHNRLRKLSLDSSRASGNRQWLVVQLVGGWWWEFGS